MANNLRKENDGVSFEFAHPDSAPTPVGSTARGRQALDVALMTPERNRDVALDRRSRDRSRSRRHANDRRITSAGTTAEVRFHVENRDSAPVPAGDSARAGSSSALALIDQTINRRGVRESRARERNQRRPIENDSDTSLDSENPRRRRRRRMEAVSDSTSEDEPIPRAEENSIARFSRDRAFSKHWSLASKHFQINFEKNDFGHTCDVCDRLWFRNDLKKTNKATSLELLQREFPGCDVSTFQMCSNCRLNVTRCNKLPALAKTNGFSYPPAPNLPTLDIISERLISPRLPFMQIRRLRYHGQSILGQVINVPVDVQTMVTSLPRNLGDDHAININIKKNLVHKSNYLSGAIKKRVIKAWLDYLKNQPLYRQYNITIDWNQSSISNINNQTARISSHRSDIIETLTNNDPDSEAIAASQQTLMWNEEYALNIAPGQRNIPMNIIFDTHAEELSFPSIYFGVARTFKDGVRVTPYMMATSEIRRTDRRGVKPNHILYMAMKILRLRIVDGVHHTFKSVSALESITREDIENPLFYESFAERNFAFLKSLPNSMVYWHNKRNDLFAMIRQLGKPTMFLTMSANEIKWPHLLITLYKLNNLYKNIDNVEVNNITDKLNRYQRSILVNEDPVVCCVYFQKILDTIMKMLQTSCQYNPFGKYKVIDYFLRIEFQHRGSPHAHILLWLSNDPAETVAENNMTGTIKLITDLCSVSSADLPNEQISNQIHKHTFTCFKRGENQCRFNIPYWPIIETCVLLPLANDDNRLKRYKKKAVEMKTALETRNFLNIDEFLIEFNVNYEQYLTIIKSSLSRPTVLFKRDMTQIYTNTFNPWIASVLNSNMDLQFILEEYSCAQYVVEYVNKSNRGISQLHREMIKLFEENPDSDYKELIKKISIRLLNNVEMSCQEAAWFLLRQPMCHASRMTVFIPTHWPEERFKALKTRSAMNRQGLDADSTDIWTKNIIQKYEERPADLNETCLADFVAWYTADTKRSRNAVDEDIHEEEEEEEVEASITYRRRLIPKIIRYRNYEVEDITNYKREMVLLFLPFRNEVVDILDRNKFLELYDTNESLICQKRREYESNINIVQLMAEIRLISENDPLQNNLEGIQNERHTFVQEVARGNDNNDDFNTAGNEIAAVKKRTNVMSKEQYCEVLRKTNSKQRELVLEFIHRLSLQESEPIQVFLAGPAGSGKTFTIKLLMETVNRYGQQQNELRNAYVACASTGKAAINLNGTTVHSAFKITPHCKTISSMPYNIIQQYQRQFASVQLVIIDEISMIGSDLFHKVHSRIQDITCNYDAPFGNINILLVGDFHQLPPVNARAIYKGSRDMIAGNALWQNMNYYKLTQVMRQTDQEFSAILTKIGNGTRLESNEKSLIESRFKSKEWCRDNLKDVVRLFHRNSSVDAYNNSAIQSNIICVAEDTIIGYQNRDDLVKSRTKLHRMSTAELGGLPYSIALEIGFPYMITVNINVDDAIVNGIIGVLKFIEYDETSDENRSLIDNINNEHNYSQQPTTSHIEHNYSQQPRPQQQRQNIIKRVWLEFPNEETGKMARIKVKPFVLTKFSNNLTEALKWTPITKAKGSISLTRTIKCKRSQFQLTPAAAITIHKAQGATFDRIVYDYDKCQINQLVYVALSRVTSLDGLFLTNNCNNFNFYHAAGSQAPTVREINDEYLRLEQHHLPTITDKALKFFHTEQNENCLFIGVINAQSLVAHFQDIQTDEVLMKCDYFALTETWMPSDKQVEINNYELITAKKGNSDFSEEASTSRAAMARVTRSGGVAIYKKINTASQACVLNVLRTTGDARVGDICFAEITLNSQTLFHLGCVYIHPNVSLGLIKQFLFSQLFQYSAESASIDEEFTIDTESALLIVGDFNVDVSKHEGLLSFMKTKFNLDYTPNDSPTTIGGTNIDLIFTRNITATLCNFISYFSYHRPILCKITK